MVRRFAVCVLVGAVALGVAPRPAGAVSERGVTDDHYRCMYHCDERAHLFEDTAPPQESRPGSLAQTTIQPKSTFCQRTAPDPANPVTNVSTLADRLLSWLHSAFCTSPTAQPAASPFRQAGFPLPLLLPTSPRPAPAPTPAPVTVPPSRPPTMGKPSGWWPWPFPSGGPGSSGPSLWNRRPSRGGSWWDGWSSGGPSGWDGHDSWDDHDPWDHGDWWNHDWWGHDDGGDPDDRWEHPKRRDHDDDDRWEHNEKRRQDDDDRSEHRKKRDHDDDDREHRKRRDHDDDDWWKSRQERDGDDWR